MTGNKAYLSDYEDLNGGFVAFGNELKFNLFSVSQMCDKKNSILFTESGCLILSPSFKLLDENKHNMVAFLKKPNESVGFTEVVDFLKVRTLANETQQLVASIDSKEYTITKTSIRSKLQLEDATGIHNLSNAKIYAGLATLGGYAVDIVPLPPAMLAGAAMDQGNTSGSVEASIQLKELMKVKSLEKALKRKSKKVIVSASEGKEPEDQGRIIQDIDDDPLVSLVRESMKEKSTDFVTPTKASGEAQEEEISPTILEAAKTLSKVASQSVSKAKSTDKGKRYRRRARSMAKKINTELDAEDEINTGRVEINSGIEDVNTGSSKVDTGRTSISTSSIIHSPKKGQREGKAQMVEEDIQATHKTKEQIRQEEAGLEEAIRLQAQMDEEVAKQIHLDKMLAKRVQEEQELSEQQLKRKAEVQKAAQFYTEEDWDTIRAKLEANTEVVKSLGVVFRGGFCVWLFCFGCWGGVCLW
ncbi:hypothetical protein Tco_0421313 [Tanacetum coccineum]